MYPRRHDLPRASILSAPPKMRHSLGLNRESSKMSSNMNKTIQIRTTPFEETLRKPRAHNLMKSTSSKYKELAKSYSPIKELRKSPRMLLATLGHIKENPRASLKVFSLEAWKKANLVHPSKKVFVINGDYPDVRKAMLARGWVENTESKSSFFNLIWTRSSKLPMDLKDWQVINHFGSIYEISTKKHFAENIKRLTKWQIDPNTFFPRCFNISDPTNYAKFLDTFHFQAVRLK